MAGRFVRASKYRHVFGQPTRKEQCYDNLRISRNAFDTNLIKANPEYLAVNWEASGGGAFAVLPLNEKGRLPERFPLFRGHTAVVLDTDWNPFNDSLIASGSDDGKVFLWRVPDNFTLHSDLPADEIQDIAPVGKLSGHPKKVGHVLFNPAAENVLASASGDFTIKLWDIEAGSPKLSLKVGDVVQSLSWSANGSLLVTTSRDKKLRVWDVRQQKPAQEVQGHSGAKNSRAVWLGEHDRVATTGFSRMSDRQLALWDIRAPREPLGGFQQLDSISGVCMPFWDEGTQCLYLAGKGDGNIRYLEYENDKFEQLSEYKSSDPQRGVAFLPKRGVNMHANEVMRAYKTVNDSYIEPISFIVPRRSETFQEDVYPPTTGLKPGLSNSDWFAGKDGFPPKVSMESLYEGDGMKEVMTESRPAANATQPIRPSESVQTKVEPPEPEPTAAATRAPPPSMKEQGGSMMSMADKYADKGADKEDSDDASSFEEIQKPVERSSAVKPTSSEVTRDEAVAPASSLWQAAEETERGPGPSVVDKPDEVVLPPSKHAASASGSATPTTPAIGLGASNSDLLEREIRNLKSVMAQQTRQISNMALTMDVMKSEIDNLKDKVGE